MEGILNPDFSAEYEKNKKAIYEELNGRINTVILNSIKGYLREKEIAFDGSILDLKEFKTKIVPTLDKQTQIDIANIEQGLNEQLSKLTGELRDGSTTAFRKFTEKIGGFSKSTIETIARLTAIKTACLLSPTAGSVILGVSILAPKVIKTGKDIRKDMQENTKAALDVMLLKLGTATKDNQKRYEVSEENRKIIASNLKREGIEVATYDTIHFLQDLSKLENSQKEKAVNMLNDLSGKPYDVKKEIDKTKIDLAKIKKAVGKDIIAPLSSAALFGMAAGSTLSQTMPDLVPSLVTSLSTGALTGNLEAGVLGGGVQYVLSKFGNYIPFVGNVIEDVTQTIGAQETILATTGVAAVATLGLKIIPKVVYKGAKGTLDKMKRKKEAKDKKRELDTKIAIEDVEKRIEKAKQECETEIAERKDKDILIDIVADTLRSQGISIPQQVRTQDELKVYVNQLPDKEKREVYKVVNILEEIKENNTKSLKTTLAKVAKVAYWGGVLALAGLGAYDTFINPAFLEGLSKRDEIKQELQQLEQDKLSQEQMEQIQEEKIQAIKDEMEAEIQTKIDGVKGFLPEQIEETEILTEPGFWTAKNCIGNRVVVKGIDLDTEEGLLNFFQNIDGKDERLLDLMNKANVTTVEELASSDYIKHVINGIGNHNYYLAGYGKDGMLDFYQFDFFDKGKMQTDLIELVNEQFRTKLANLPLKNATQEEIVDFIESTVAEPDKLKYLAVYLEATQQKNGNYLIENLVDACETWKLIPESTTSMEEAQRKMEEVRRKIEKYTEQIEELKGLDSGVKSQISNNPIEIFASGSLIGATAGFFSETTKKIKKFIDDKIFKKNKALPVTTQETEEQEEKETRKKLDVKIKPKDMANIEKKERDLSKEKEEPKMKQDENRI